MIPSRILPLHERRSNWFTWPVPIHPEPTSHQWTAKNISSAEGALGKVWQWLGLCFPENMVPSALSWLRIFGQCVPYSIDLEDGMSCNTEMNECGRALEMPKGTVTTCLREASEGVCLHSSKQYPRRAGHHHFSCLLNNTQCPMISRQILTSFVEMPILMGRWICDLILSFYFYLGRVPALFLPSDE